MKLARLQRLWRARWLVFSMAVAVVPAAAAEEALTPAQKSAVEQTIRDYLVSHPDVLLDALKAAQQKDDEQAAERSRRVIAERRKELFGNSNDLVRGNPKGDATIVEFFDYRCPYCKQLEPTLDALLQEDGKLRIVYKEFPILGEASVYAARVALAARKQSKYAEFHGAMMAARGDITDAVVLKVAASVGLDLDRIKADMGGSDIDRIISSNYGLANALSIEGTPGLILGDAVVPGAVDIDTLRKGIAAARKGS